MAKFEVRPGPVLDSGYHVCELLHISINQMKEMLLAESCGCVLSEAVVVENQACAQTAVPVVKIIIADLCRILLASAALFSSSSYVLAGFDIDLHELCASTPNEHNSEYA